MIDPNHQLPLSGGDGSPSVPVFDCHVIVSPPDDSGNVHARAVRLPGVTGVGSNEREALRSIVEAFKSEVKNYVEQGKSIPWSDTPDQPGDGEAERWIPVHL